MRSQGQDRTSSGELQAVSLQESARIRLARGACNLWCSGGHPTGYIAGCVASWPRRAYRVPWIPGDVRLAAAALTGKGRPGMHTGLGPLGCVAPVRGCSMRDVSRSLPVRSLPASCVDTRSARDMETAATSCKERDASVCHDLQNAGRNLCASLAAGRRSGGICLSDA